ncbi:MAG: hypothetical protein MUE69_10685 [Myxococcota bacterium]|jgi:hypothetical protein|nr:hypothetical protein [Myxococcota bacterium]
MQRTITIALMCALGCGGGGSEDGVGSTSTAGSEEEVARPTPIEEPIEEEEPEPQAEVADLGEGQVRIVLKVGNETAAGRVQLLDESGAVVAEGGAGESFTLPEGRYRVVATLDPGALAGATPREDALFVEPGQSERTITWEVTRVRFAVRRRGQPVSRWRIVAQREGGEELTFEPTEEFRVVMPGRYRAVLTFGAQRVEVNGLIFQGGATQTVPVDVN